MPEETLDLLKAAAADGTPVLAAVVGSHFFARGSLEIDLKRHRIRFATTGRLAKVRSAHPLTVATSSAGLGSAPLVDIKRGREHFGYALIDTGVAYSLAPLTEQTWSAWTGRRISDPTLDTFEEQSWGERIRCVTAPVVAPLAAGDVALQGQLAAYCSGIAFKPTFQIDALVGLHAFEQRTLILDFVSRKWLVKQVDSQ